MVKIALDLLLIYIFYRGISNLFRDTRPPQQPPMDNPASNNTVHQEPTNNQRQAPKEDEYIDYEEVK